MTTPKILQNTKVNFFALGILAATAGVKFIKSETFHKGCVNLVAGGMKIRNDAAASISKIKEDAEDVCFDAEIEAADEE